LGSERPIKRSVETWKGLPLSFLNLSSWVLRGERGECKRNALGFSFAKEWGECGVELEWGAPRWLLVE
jgi:hypothetical protein